MIWGTNDDNTIKRVNDLTEFNEPSDTKQDDDLFENVGDINNKQANMKAAYAASQEKVAPTNPFASILNNPQTNASISIPNTVERKGKLTKYTAYVIESSVFGGSTSVARRFNDFKWLHNMLGVEYLGVFIPPLPPDNALGRFNDDVVTQRRYDLERCLKRINNSAILQRSASFELFLCEQNDALFEENKKTFKKTLYERTEYDIHTLLNRCFEDFNCGNVADFLSQKPGAKQIESDNEETYQLDMPRVREFFMRCDERLSSLNKISNNLFRIFVDIDDELKVFREELSNLYDAEYNDKPLIMMDKCAERKNIGGFMNKWSVIEELQTCCFYKHFVLHLRYEHEDVKAILDQFVRYDTIYLKYKKQKASFRKLSEKYPDKNHTEAEDKLIEIKSLLDIICTIILINQTPQIWKNKIKKYNQSIHEYIKSVTQKPF